MLLFLSAHRRPRQSRRRTALLTLALSLSTTAGGTLMPSAAADRQAKLRALRVEIHQLAERIETTTGRRDQGQAALQQTEQRIQRAARQEQSATVAVARNRQQKAQFDRQVRDLKAHMHQDRQALARLVRNAYFMGGNGYLKLLLDQRDPHRIDRTLAYYRYITTARSARITALQRKSDALQVLTDQTRQQATQLAASRLALAAQRQALESLRVQRQAQIAALDRQIETDTDRMGQLKANEQRLNQLIQALLARRAREQAKQRAVAQQRARARGKQNAAPPATNPAPVASAGAGFGAMRSKLRLPIAGRIRARFGDVRPDSGLKWEGVLFAAPAGETVNAIYSGTVSYADWFRGFGLLLIIDHGNGYMSLYSHNQRLLKSAGDPVRAGDPIATTGETGGLSAPGLYFEVRKDGKPRDPLLWCKRS